MRIDINDMAELVGHKVTVVMAQANPELLVSVRGILEYHDGHGYQMCLADNLGEVDTCFRFPEQYVSEVRAEITGNGGTIYTIIVRWGGEPK